MPKRIDVTVEQLKSIYGQLYDQLEEKAALHLPPQTHADTDANTTADDTVRREVQLQLQDYLTQVMEMTSNSLRVMNTNDEIKNIRELITKSQEKYVEPFDLNLNERVRQKYQEWEAETVKVSQLRQNAPREINRIYNNSREEYLSALDDRIAELEEKPQLKSIETGDQDTANQFCDDVASRYEQSLRYLSQAQRQMPATRTDIDKIRALVQYLETELK